MEGGNELARGVCRRNCDHRLCRPVLGDQPMTALLPLTSQRPPGFRTSNRANTRALRGRGQSGPAKAGLLHSAQALEAVTDAEPGKLGSAPDATSFQIAERYFLPPLGNTRVPQPTSSPAGALHPLRSLERQALDQFGSQCSERNKSIPVRVGNDADLRAGRAQLSWKRPALRLFSKLVGFLGHRSSVRSPANLCLFKFGSRNSEHESKGLADDGNLTAQRIKLTARGRNAKG